jgi:hypothetical protein
MAAAAQAAGAGYHPLEYEQQIVEELTAEDGLCITAAGLGWHRVVAAMLAMHDDPEHGEVCQHTHHGNACNAHAHARSLLIQSECLPCV